MPPPKGKLPPPPTSVVAQKLKLAAMSASMGAQDLETAKSVIPSPPNRFNRTKEKTGDCGGEEVPLVGVGGGGYLDVSPEDDTAASTGVEAGAAASETTRTPTAASDDNDGGIYQREIHTSASGGTTIASKRAEFTVKVEATDGAEGYSITLGNKSGDASTSEGAAAVIIVEMENVKSSFPPEIGDEVLAINGVAVDTLEKAVGLLGNATAVPLPIKLARTFGIPPATPTPPRKRELEQEQGAGVAGVARVAGVAGVAGAGAGASGVEGKREKEGNDSEAPMVQTVDVLNECSRCGAGGAKLTCSRCKKVRYCNSQCQSTHWKAGGHKAVCKPPPPAPRKSPCPLCDSNEDDRTVDTSFAVCCCKCGQLHCGGCRPKLYLDNAASCGGCGASFDVSMPDKYAGMWSLVHDKLPGKYTTHAAVAIAHAHAEGRGVDQNMEEAVRWYIRAAEGGRTEAQYFLGRAYLQGEGTLKRLKR